MIEDRARSGLDTLPLTLLEGVRGWVGRSKVEATFLSESAAQAIEQIKG